MGAKPLRDRGRSASSALRGEGQGGRVLGLPALRPRRRRARPPHLRRAGRGARHLGHRRHEPSRRRRGASSGGSSSISCARPPHRTTSSGARRGRCWGTRPNELALERRALAAAHGGERARPVGHALPAPRRDRSRRPVHRVPRGRSLARAARGAQGPGRAGCRRRARPHASHAKRGSWRGSSTPASRPFTTSGGFPTAGSSTR